MQLIDVDSSMISGFGHDEQPRDLIADMYSTERVR
jgi:hypothetical protein